MIDINKLNKLYHKLSGLVQIDVEKFINNYPDDKKPFAYRKLIWNIPRGRMIKFVNQYAKDFAFIICNLALLTNLDIHSEDIIPDGIINKSDFYTHLEIEFAHKIIENCEHFEKILNYLLNEEGDYLVCEEDEETKILIE